MFFVPSYLAWRLANKITYYGLVNGHLALSPHIFFAKSDLSILSRIQLQTFCWSVPSVYPFVHRFIMEVQRLEELFVPGVDYGHHCRQGKFFLFLSLWAGFIAFTFYRPVSSEVVSKMSFSLISDLLLKKFRDVWDN